MSSRCFNRPGTKNGCWRCSSWSRQYVRADTRTRQTIHQLYLRNTKSINNWDLVDSSAAQIVGAHLETGDRRVLRRLARSKSVWERRIAMIATYHYIRQGDFKDALAIAALLRRDEHDLIHKAVGWMLREIGKRDRSAEERFLRKHSRGMPRTMLRYAIEKFPQPLRRKYLSVSHRKDAATQSHLSCRRNSLRLGVVAVRRFLKMSMRWTG